MDRNRKSFHLWGGLSCLCNSLHTESEIKISRYKIRAHSLRGNLPGDPDDREIMALEYIPEKSESVHIGLAGFFGTSYSFLNRSFTGMDFIAVLETLIRRRLVRSFIIVLPDTMTSFGGNQYVNSSAVGNYEDFISSDLTGWIRKKYGKRTVGLFGKSSGGFGSYTLAAMHPNTFGGFVDVSGDSGFEYCYMRDIPDTISVLKKNGLESFLSKFRRAPFHTKEELNAASIVAASAFYSPLPSGNGKFSLPFNEKTGEFRDDVWKRWLEFDPARNIDRYAEALRDKTVILQTGRKDDYSINIGMSIMSQKLSNSGIDHKFITYDCGHFGIEYLYLYSLPMLMNGLEG